MAETTLDINVNYNNLDASTSAATSAVNSLVNALDDATSASEELGKEGVESQNAIKNATDDTAASTDAGAKAIKKYSDTFKKSNKELKAGARTFKELQDRAAALNEQFEEAEFGSAAYKQLRKDLIEVNKEIKNTELSIEALDSEQVASEVGGLVGGFADVATGAVLAFGVSEDSAEDFLKTLAQVEGAGKLVKGSIEGVQAGLKLYNNVVKSNSVITRISAAATAAWGVIQNTLTTTLGATSGALKVLKFALAATGIGLIIVGIGALVANFEDLQKTIVGAAESVANFFGFSISGTKELTAAQKEANKVRARQSALIDEAVALGKEELSTANTLLGALANQTISKEDQARAYQRLNDLYPDILANYSSEEEVLNNIDTIQQEITKSIAEQTLERLKAQKIQELQNKLFQEQLTTAQAQRKVDAGRGDEVDALIAAASRSGVEVSGTRDELANLEGDIAAIQGDILAIFQQTNAGLDLAATSSEQVSDTLDGLDDRFSERADKAKAAADKAAAEAKKFADELLKLEQQLQKQSDDAEFSLLGGEARIEQERINALAAVDALGQQLLEARRKVLGDEAELTAEQLEQLDSLRVKAETESANKIAALRLSSLQERLSGESEIISQQISQIQALADAQLASIPEGISEEERLLRELEIRRSVLTETLALQDEEFNNKQRQLQAELDSVKLLTDEESQLRARVLEEQIKTNQAEQALNKANVDKQVSDIEKAIDDLNKKQPFSLQKLLGVTDEEFAFVKEQFQNLVSTLGESITQVTDAQIEENGRLIDAINTRISETESALEREIELNQLGFASNVEGKRQELAALQAQREQALAQQEELQKKQARIQQAQILAESAVQTSQLITAAATLIKEGSKFFPVGLAIAAGLIGTLFATFAKIKSTAKQATVPQFRKGGGFALSGASHEQGGIGLFDSVSGNKLAEFEGNEFLYVVNKESTKKHLPLLKAINGGNQAEIERIVGMKQLNFKAMQTPSIIHSSASSKGVEKRIDALNSKVEKLSNHFMEKEEEQDFGDYKVVRKGNITKKVWKNARA